MRCIETAKTFASEVLKKIKSNMRCIETAVEGMYHNLNTLIKSNMRCIETLNIAIIISTVSR